MIRKTIMLISLFFVFQCNNKFSHLNDGLYAQLDTNRGYILMKLTDKKTPNTVANFVSLAEGDNQFVSDKYKSKKFYKRNVYECV